jgi:hypothetical protein
MSHNSCIVTSGKIKDVDKFFEKNQNSIYIFKTIGIREFEEDDEIGLQIKKLQLEYKFNINEIILFKTFYTRIIFIYVPMTKELYYFQFVNPILNAFILVDNIILFYLYKTIQIVDIKYYITKIYKIEKFSLEMISDLTMKFLKEEEKDKIKLTISNIDSSDLILQTAPIKNNITNSIVIKKKAIQCEKLWSTFVLQTESCYCISNIESEVRIFKYIIILNDNEEKLLNLIELLTFLDESFYSPLKYITFLYTK